MTQQVKDPHHLGFHMWRNFQRLREAWWIVTGRWSLHRAWQYGYDHGTRMEYQRIITNKGDFNAQKKNVLSDALQQSRRVRNFSNPDETLEAVPLWALTDGTEAAQR